jgi:hypothetical protein
MEEKTRGRRREWEEKEREKERNKYIYGGKFIKLNRIPVFRD